LIGGNLESPLYQQLPNLMAEFSEQLQFLLSDINNEEKLTYALAYAHHKIVQIHPFHNGNGRTARLVTNLIAYLHGYEAIQIYHRKGDARSEYIRALKQADNHDYQPLQTLIKDRLRRL
jgi:cell filamentation protein